MSNLTTRIPFVDLASQHGDLESEILAAVRNTLRRSDFVLGSCVAQFEKAFAEYIQVDYAVGTGCGLDALRLALMALSVRENDEVIVPVNSFIATALAVSALGARPVFVDCDASTLNIDIRLIAPAITPRTKAIIAVHLAGQPAEMDPVLEIAARHQLDVIEDAAQAHGATYKDRMCGSMGRIGCFSFYPAKNLGACGDGGAVTTNDAQLAERVRLLGNYGQEAKYHHKEKGLNTRLDTVQASILQIKLPRLDRWNESRRANAVLYRESLEGVGDIAVPDEARHTKHVYHLFVIFTEKRDQLRAYLSKAGIDTGIHYPRPLHQQPAYRDLGYQDESFPQAVRLSRTMLSLPMYPQLTREQIEVVCSHIRAFFAS